MRRYVRREVLLDNNINVSNQNITLNDESSYDNKFLAYCNWSFAKEKQLKRNEALTIFDRFEKEKSPIYVRIFNEMPRSVLEKFVEKNHISKDKIKSIYTELQEKTSYKVEKYE